MSFTTCWQPVRKAAFASGQVWFVVGSQRRQDKPSDPAIHFGEAHHGHLRREDEEAHHRTSLETQGPKPEEHLIYNEQKAKKDMHFFCRRAVPLQSNPEHEAADGAGLRPLPRRLHGL